MSYCGHTPELVVSVMPWLLIINLFWAIKRYLICSYVRDWKDIIIVLCIVDQYVIFIYIIFLEIDGTIF